MYRDLFKELILKQAELYEKVRNNDYSDVCYREGQDAEYGRYDQNYINRLRLSYYILFEKIGDVVCIERLFAEELQDRQTNDFQGIGSALEILTTLLMQYQTENQYDTLFERAKNANFDCACGYDTAIEIASDYNEYELDDCINIATEMGELAYAQQFVTLWKDGITNWDEQTYRSLIYYNKGIGNAAENEEPLKALLAIALEHGQTYHIISGWRALIAYYTQFAQWEEAYQNLIAMVNRVDFTEVYHINLFNFILEDCMEVICNHRARAESLWQWAKPFIAEKAADMYGNLYRKSIAAAEAVQDPLAEALLEQYRLWQKKTGIFAK